MEQNILLNKDFKQVCVWKGCVVGKDKIDEFIKFMADNFKGTRVQYLEEIKTLPGDGGEGGRNDLFFAVHNNDIIKFTIPRLKYGISWIEDTIMNSRKIYPDRISKYKSW